MHENVLRDIFRRLNTLEKKMAQIDDLNAAITALQQAESDTNSRVSATLNTLSTVEAQLTALQAQGTVTPVDLSAPLAAIQAMTAALQGIDPAPAAPATAS